MFLSNEELNELISSNEERIEDFKTYTDYGIGEPYYFYKLEEIWCKTHSCLPLNDQETEYMPMDDPKSQCVIAWLVDSTKKGKHSHQNGMVFDIAGIKKSWRYVSDPQLCLHSVNYYGPW